MNVVLTGYRGTGKTVTGKLLARMLGSKYVSTDTQIVKSAKRTIPQIVKKYGWPRFRQIESKIAQKISKKDKLVIDTGGGIILKRRNVQVLKRNGIFVWLKAGRSTIVKRIRHDKNRPSLTGAGFVKEISAILKKRTPLYRKYSDIQIATDNISAKKVAERIKKKVVAFACPINRA